MKSWVVILLGLSVLAQATTGPPPLPPKVRVWRHVDERKGAEMLMVKPKIQATTVFIAPLVYSLAWDWTPNAANPASNVVFVVYGSDRMLPNRSDWTTVKGVTALQTWPLTIDTTIASQFFIVRASNFLTGAISE